MRSLSVLLLVIGSLMLAGCPKKPTTVVDDAGAASEDSAASEGQGAGQVGAGRDLPGASGSPSGGPAGVGNVFYFDFDRSDIRPEYASAITARHPAESRSGSRATRTSAVPANTTSRSPSVVPRRFAER